MFQLEGTALEILNPVVVNSVLVTFPVKFVEVANWILDTVPSAFPFLFHLAVTSTELTSLIP